MRKYLPFIISFFCLLVSILFWDKITLPYDESNSIIGQYSLKKINPLNDLLRFLIFIIPATLIYLVSFLYFNKSTYNLNKNNSEYF